MFAFILLILAFFLPKYGPPMFICLMILTELWMFAVMKSKIKVKNSNDKYTFEEVKIIEKYPVFFQYPVASRQLSKLFSGFQISILIFVPLMLFRGMWIYAIIGVVEYFIVPQFAVPLNPQHFFIDNLSKDKIKDPEMKHKVAEDLKNLESALKKIFDK